MLTLIFFKLIIENESSLPKFNFYIFQSIKEIKN